MNAGSHRAASFSACHMVAQEALQRGNDAEMDGARPQDDRFDADWRRVDDLCDQKVCS